MCCCGSEQFFPRQVIREWLEEVLTRPEFEFRCFVSRRSLNAITQYQTALYSAALAQQRQQTLERLQVHQPVTDNLTLLPLQEFFRQFLQRSTLPHESYVVDLFVRTDGSVLSSLMLLTERIWFR
jgi:hypothetical protein